MNKILLFDIDDTIAERNKKISNDLLSELERLSTTYYIVFISGKPSCYIFGMLRQIECLKNISIIGENGATISVGSNFPPNIFYQYQKNNDTKNIFNNIREILIQKFGDEIWFQPNEVNLTIFSKDKKYIDELYDILLSFKTDDLIVYKHNDSVEILPSYINKKTSVQKYLEITGLSNSSYEIHAFGDSINDLPMFEIADFIYIIGDKLAYKKKNTAIENVNNLADYLKNNFI